MPEGDEKEREERIAAGKKRVSESIRVNRTLCKIIQLTTIVSLSMSNLRSRSKRKKARSKVIAALRKKIPLVRRALLTRKLWTWERQRKLTRMMP